MQPIGPDWDTESWNWKNHCVASTLENLLGSFSIHFGPYSSFPVISAHVRPFPSFLVKRSNSQSIFFCHVFHFPPSCTCHLSATCHLSVATCSLLLAIAPIKTHDLWRHYPGYYAALGVLVETLTLTLAPSPRKLKKQKKPNPDPGFASLKLIESSRVSGPDVGPKNGRVRHGRVNVDY